MSVSPSSRRKTQPATEDGVAASVGDARGSAKGRQTKAAIVDAALRLAGQVGLGRLSIGAVAELMQMSKSGVFAHFGAREELQISVVREYFLRFEQEVFSPVLALPRGLPRVEALFGNWMQRVAVRYRHAALPERGAGELKIIAAILARPVIEKIMSHLGLDPQPPPKGRVREAGQY